MIELTREELKEKRLQLLNETASFFNLNNRSELLNSIGIGTGICKYFMEGKDGCAIGRKIADKELCKKMDANIDENGDSLTSISNKSTFEMLPDDLKQLGQLFLYQLQSFHDYNNNWTNEGISEAGLGNVTYIKRCFEL